MIIKIILITMNIMLIIIILSTGIILIIKIVVITTIIVIMIFQACSQLNQLLHRNSADSAVNAWPQLN